MAPELHPLWLTRALIALLAGVSLVATAWSLRAASRLEPDGPALREAERMTRRDLQAMSLAGTLLVWPASFLALLAASVGSPLTGDPLDTTLNVILINALLPGLVPVFLGDALRWQRRRQAGQPEEAPGTLLGWLGTVLDRSRPAGERLAALAKLTMAIAPGLLVLFPALKHGGAGAKAVAAGLLLGHIGWRIWRANGQLRAPSAAARFPAR